MLYNPIASEAATFEKTPQTHASNTPAILDIHDLTVAYQRKPVLWNVDLVVREPSLIGIIGPNGAGKSTLIKAALGLLPLIEGETRFFGKKLSQVRQKIAYVPQRESVPWDFPVSVLDVVLMGCYGRLGWFRRPGKLERHQAMRALEKVAMVEFANRQIGQLSGGQQQRVFLARAIVQDAELYFLDEPMAGVDAATEEAVFQLLRSLRNAGRTVFVVHHDLRTVTRYFEKVALLNMRLVAFGPVADTFTPQNLQTTYGGRLAILDTLGGAIAKADRSA